MPNITMMEAFFVMSKNRQGRTSQQSRTGQQGRTRRHNSIAARSGGTVLPPESLDFDAAQASFIRFCRVKNLTDLTITYYNDVLKELRRLLDIEGVDEPHNVTREHVESCIMAKRDEGVKDVTVERYFRGWRAFFNWLTDGGYITDNPVKGIRIKSESRVIDTFTKPQLRKLFDQPDRTTFTGYRDYVIMLTLLDTGVRISELEGMLIPNINWDNRLIRVYGKGRKERYVPFQSNLAGHLQEYISIRGPLEHDFLWVNIDNTPIRKRTIQQHVSGYGRDANIKGVRCSPHTFRHTFAKLYVMNGGDPFSLQK